MLNLPLRLILSYCVFSIFVSYQYNQARYQRYLFFHNRYINYLIKVFACSSIAFQYGFIIYYGYTRKWYAALLLLVIGVTVDVSYDYVEENFTEERFAVYLFLLSFVILPLFAYAMITSLPQS
jgi:predicted Na+-dependent transporter